jgi:hypothetical protein
MTLYLFLAFNPETPVIVVSKADKKVFFTVLEKEKLKSLISRKAELISLIN